MIRKTDSSQHFDDDLGARPVDLVEVRPEPHARSAGGVVGSPECPPPFTKNQDHYNQLQHRFHHRCPDTRWYPKTYSAVLHHATRGALRSLLLAYGIRATLTFALKLLNAWKRKLSLLDVFRSSYLGSDALRMGATAGLFSFIWKSLNHGLRLARGNKEDRWNGLVSGGMAGLAIALESKGRRETFSQQFAVRALQSIYNGAKSREIFYFKHGDALLFILCSAQVMYGYVMRPESLQPAMYKFMLVTAEMPKAIIQATAAALERRPLDISSTVELAKKFKATPENLAILAALPSPPNLTPCALLHPSHNSCTVKAARLWANVFQRIFPIYASLNFVPMILLRLNYFLREPVRLLQNAIKSTMRSSAFLAFFVSGYQAQNCLYRRVVGKDVWASSLGRLTYRKYLYWLFGAVTASSIFVERKDRRSELALYLLPRAIESLYHLMYRRRLIFRMRYFEIFLCSISTAIIMSFYQQEPEVLSPMIYNIFAKLFGKY